MNFQQAEIGSVVSIRGIDDYESYLLVEDQDEDPFTHRVSIHSPIGKSLYHKQKYDLVNFDVPGDSHTYIVTNVFQPI